MNGITRREFLIRENGRMGGVLNLLRVAEEVFVEKEFYEIL